MAKFNSGSSILPIIKGSNYLTETRSTGKQKF